MRVVPSGSDGVRTFVDKEFDNFGHDLGQDPIAGVDINEKDFAAQTGVDLDKDSYTAFAHVPFFQGNELKWADAPLSNVPNDAFFTAQAPLKFADEHALEHEGVSFFLKPNKPGGEEIQLQDLGHNTGVTQQAEG